MLSYSRAALVCASVLLNTACPASEPTEPGPGPGPGPTIAAATVSGTPQAKQAGSASDEMVVRITSDGAPSAGATVTWSTTGGTLAATSTTTSGQGLAVNALTNVGATAGTITVTASSGGASAAFSITVSTTPPVVSSISYGPKVAVLDSAATTSTLTATVKDANGNAMSGQTVTFASRAPAIATVNASGQVTGLTRGQAVIVASVSANSQTYTDSLLAVVAVPGGPVVLTDIARFDLKKDTTFTVTVVADMRASTTRIGSARMTLAWDPAVLTYQSNAEGSSSVGAAVNADDAATGSLVMAFASSAGFGGRVEVRKVTFKAATASAAGTLTLTTQEASDAAYASLLSKTVSVSTPIFTR